MSSFLIPIWCVFLGSRSVKLGLKPSINNILNNVFSLERYYLRIRLGTDISKLYSLAYILYIIFLPRNIRSPFIKTYPTLEMKTKWERCLKPFWQNKIVLEEEVHVLIMCLYLIK